MEGDLALAKKLLFEKALTLAAVKDGRAHTSRERGVKPLLQLLDGGLIPRGFSAADRVVGRGAAFLYVLLGADRVWAQVMSRGAEEVFHRFSVEYDCETSVDAIRNRAGDGFCPIESAVAEVSDPVAALDVIRRTLISLQKNPEQG